MTPGEIPFEAPVALAAFSLFIKGQRNPGNGYPGFSSGNRIIAMRIFNFFRRAPAPEVNTV